MNIQNWKATAGSGVSRLTGPYKIENLIELPNNGMLMDAVTATDVEDFLEWSLQQPSRRDVYLRIGVH